MPKIHVHIHKTKDVDPRVVHLKSGIDSQKRTIVDAERALASGDLDLAGRYLISAGSNLENLGKQARSSS